MYRITISDNDFWFLIEETLNYACTCFNIYQKNCDYKKSGAETLMEIFSEYFDAMHIEKNTKEYILENLDIKVMDSPYEEDWDNGEVYYFSGDSFEKIS